MMANKKLKLKLVVFSRVEISEKIKLFTTNQKLSNTSHYKTYFFCVFSNNLEIFFYYSEFQ
ncbi:hypothetical protein BpHYR1_045324 [Brachionus plicatilis]|uniref:Uncharacterized protein n=1 Tax=Brachionus plicatilis TaxID=10195 RepID=A0A3M7QDI9_BRAPC|nr:hypothetical protein BpHYR1_045324 [Brachionus plicatilis]